MASWYFYVAQAILDFDEKKYQDAIRNLEEALKREPDHVEALYYMGVVHMALRRPEEAVRYLTRAQAKAPQDTSIAFQLGLAYFALQEYDGAEPLFERVYKADPTIEGLGYYVGFIRYRKKDYRGALEAFRRGRTTDPQLQQLTRFYTGLSLGVLGLPAQAAAEVEQALRLAPGSQLTGPAERLRDTIVASRQKERRFFLEARLGATDDDNVIVRPTENFRETLVPDLRRHTHESVGELFGLTTNYVWWRTTDWESSIGYSFFTTYVNEMPKFNVISNLFSADVTSKTTVFQLPLQTNLQYAWDILLLGDEELLTRHYVALSSVLVESAHHFTQGFVRYQAKNFAEPVNPRPVPDELRDADNYMAGFLHFIRFAENKHFIKAGYQFDWEDTEGRNYSYQGSRYSLGGQYTLPWHAIRLKYDVDLHLRSYTHRNSILPSYAAGSKWREDQEITNVVRAELPLPRNFTLAAEYQNSRVVSNIELFDYTRNVVSLILSWSY